MVLPTLTAASAGDKVTLYVTSHAARYHISAYRIGYYGGKGGRLVWNSGELKGVVQPKCTLSAGTNMVACDNWAPSITLPSGRNSYRATTSSSWSPTLASKAIYRSQYGTRPATPPMSSRTAFSHGRAGTIGGATTCTAAPRPAKSPQYANRALVESFDRPYANGNGAADFMALEYPIIYWAEEHGLDVTYWTDVTFAQFPYLLENHKALLTLGHDESWTLRERNGVIAGRAAGVNVIYFGASPVLRHVRLLPSPMGHDREEVDYRDPTADPIYSTDPLNATGNTWAQPPDDDPPSQVVGDTYQGYGLDDPMVVTDAGAWPFAGTGVTDGEQLKGVEAGDYDAYDTSQPDPPNVEVAVPLARAASGRASHVRGYDLLHLARQWGRGTGDGHDRLDPGSLGLHRADAVVPLRVVQAVTGNILRLFGKGPAGKYHPSVANWQQYY